MKNKIKIIFLSVISILLSDNIVQSNIYYFTPGPNLVSFDIIPENGNIDNIFIPVENDLISIISNGEISYNNEGNWTGSLTNLDSESGYWVIAEQISLLPINGERENIPTYYLQEGANLISYPHTNSQPLDDALPFYMHDKLIGIIGQNSAALFINGNVYGSLNTLEPNKGYWFFLSSPTMFTYNTPLENYNTNQNQNIFNEEVLEYNLSVNQSVFFVENLFINNQQVIENANLSIYCNNQLVGSKSILNEMTDLIAMGDDGFGFTNNYCTESDEIEIKINNEPLHIIGNNQWHNNTFSLINLSSHSLGDVNLDNNLNVTDIIMIIDFIIHNNYQLSNQQLLLSDYNTDSNTNVTDVIRILDTILD
mgnify:CR=1 FL=1